MRVIREGNTTEVPKCDIVVGDIVMLGTGEDIPADAELLESTHLSVDESTLTGEPLCRKRLCPKSLTKKPPSPSNHVLRGTKVWKVTPSAVSLLWAIATENGKVLEAAQIDDSVKTPLNEQLDRLGQAHYQN